MLYWNLDGARGGLRAGQSGRPKRGAAARWHRPDRTFTEKGSGKDTNRPQLEASIPYVREGDTLLVHSMDRLARDLDDLRGLVRRLTGKGVRVQFIKEGLTFTGEENPMATLMLSMMGAVAEFERSLIRESQREGVALARRGGLIRAASGGYRLSRRRHYGNGPFQGPTNRRSRGSLR